MESVIKTVSLLIIPALALAATAQVAAELIDPTAPILFKKTAKPVVVKKRAALKLSSILIARSRRIAVINHQALQVGDVVAGAKLLQIEALGVTLRRGAKIIELPLYPSKAIKRPGRPISVVPSSGDFNAQQ